MNSLYKKHLLKIFDYSKIEIDQIINLSKFLKNNKKITNKKKYLKDKKIALIFTQKSTRTRCAFEIAAFEEGAYTTYFNAEDMHIGNKESIEDTIKVFERMYDGIVYRGLNHNDIKTISKNSKIPVWNALTRKYHPTQILADILTMQEFLPGVPINKMSCAYVGDASNNIANTLLEISSILKFKLNIVAPKKYWPYHTITNNSKIIKSKNIKYTEDIKQGLKNIDFIYTDTWISMGDDLNKLDKKISILQPYKINSKILQLTNNDNVKILHCLPALHDQNTILSKKISNLYNIHNGLEISNTVFQKNKEIIFSQSENKLYTIKAMMICTLNKKII